MQDDFVNDTSEWARSTWQRIAEWTTSPEFYIQLAAIAAAIAIAFVLTVILRKSVRFFRAPADPSSASTLRGMFYRLRGFVFPLLSIVLLGIAVGLADEMLAQSWLLRIAQGLAVVLLLYKFVSRLVDNTGIKMLFRWIVIPLAVLHVFGWLDDVTGYLDGISMTVGDIHLSLFALSRTLLFGALLFWLGRISNSVGQQAIREHESLDPGTREVFAKLFQIALSVVIFLLLLQVMGVNLTALAVFGGALGVGLGFGLQQIASNFVSGVIILLDRSISIGDHIELEDGRAGILRELNMRFGVIETYDGKDIMVPNEQFITTTYTNWTHKDPKQRYSLEFQVAYSTDLDLLFDNVRAICAEHPTVISGDDVPKEFRPDAEIDGFGESGIDILVEFWMEGIDDGENRVGADLLHSIWRSIQENGMNIPFPQREVRIVGEGDTNT